jgi:GT2 family glycosyltransferase
MIAVIKTIRREESCRRCVQSVHTQLDIPVVVVDDSGDGEDFGSDYLIRTPFDVGLSAGRNLGVRLASKLDDVILLLDDDHVIGEQNGILDAEWLLHQYDLVTGVPYMHGQNNPPYYWEWLFTFPKPKTMVLTPQHERGIVHAANNFFLARSSVFDEVLWDESFKVSAEHLDFYMQLYFAHKRVFYETNMTVDHLQDTSSARYRPFRIDRIGDYDALFFQKWGISVTASDGTRMP